MRNVLITGSRNADRMMLAAVRQIVTQIARDGDRLLVGDAHGVDAFAIQVADELGVEVVVHGAYERLRHSTTNGSNCALDCNYLERDRVMAEACDVCVAVWDGQSRGTRLTAEYARKLGKPVTIWHQGVVERLGVKQ